MLTRLRGTCKGFRVQLNYGSVLMAIDYFRQVVLMMRTVFIDWNAKVNYSSLNTSFAAMDVIA